MGHDVGSPFRGRKEEEKRKRLVEHYSPFKVRSWWSGAGIIALALVVCCLVMMFMMGGAWVANRETKRTQMTNPIRIMTTNSQAQTDREFDKGE